MNTRKDTRRGRQTLMFVLVVIIAISLITTLIYATNKVNAGTNEQPALIFPFESGQNWYIVQGYNTGSHSGYQKYSFDLMIEGDTTGNQTYGRSVLAPVSGTIVWSLNNNPTHAIAIRTGKTPSGRFQCTMLAHQNLTINISPGQTKVNQGQKIGTAACNGCGSDYNHIHMTYFTTSDEWCSNDRKGEPFNNLEAKNWYVPDNNGRTIAAWQNTIVWRGMGQNESHLIQVSDLVVGKNPAHPGQTNTFTFKVKNTGGSTAKISEVWVEGTTPTGGLWKGWADPVNIGSGQTQQYKATAPMWSDNQGVWTIKEVIYRTPQMTYHSIPTNGNTQSQKFVVYSENTVVKNNSNGDLYLLKGNRAKPIDNNLTYYLLGAPTYHTHSHAVIVGMNLGPNESSGMQIGRTGNVVTHNWYSIQFPKPYGSQPVIVAQIVTENGADNAHIDIKNVTKNGFMVRVEEDIPLDVNHTKENVHWIAIPNGGYGIVKAGRTGSIVTHEWHTEFFNSAFPKIPIVVASIVTENGVDNSHIDITGVTKERFKVRVEEDLSKDGNHPNGENIHYLAIKPGDYGKLKARKTGYVVTDKWFQVNWDPPYGESPVLIAVIATEKGSDNSHIDIRNLSSSGFQARVEEDTEADGVHVNGEQIHYIAIRY